MTGAGINCGAGSATCAVTMPAAMKIGITATASSGYTFTGWSGDCSGTAESVWVDLKGARTCAATFTSSGGTTYSLAISPAPAGGTVSGNGLTCGAGGAACSVDVREFDNGDADGDAGQRLHVHELGRRVQRHERHDERPG